MPILTISSQIYSSVSATYQLVGMYNIDRSAYVKSNYASVREKVAGKIRPNAEYLCGDSLAAG
jgi:hypothetical protein